MPPITRGMAKRNKKKVAESRASRVKSEDCPDPSAAQSAEVDIPAAGGSNCKVPPPTFAGPSARLQPAAGCATTSNVARSVEADSSADDDESEDGSSTVSCPDSPGTTDPLKKDRTALRCQTAIVPLSFWAVVAAVAVLAVVMAAIFRTYCCHKAANARPLSENRDLRNQLVEQFPGQPRRFYSTVAAAVQAVQTVTVQPQPAALLFVSSDATVRSEVSAIAQCLAHLLERNLTGRRSATVIEGASQGLIQPDESKLLIDQQLEAHFSSSSRVAVVTDIEKLSLHAAKIFYKYCDHENAPHKNVIFVLTIAVGDELAESQLESAVEAALLKSWSPEPDDVAPILTRVANHLIALRPLPRFMCKFDD